MPVALETYNNLQNAKNLIGAEMISIEKEYRCFTCDHFDRKDGYCVQWNAKPPEAGVKAGCDKHENIPF